MRSEVLDTILDDVLELVSLDSQPIDAQTIKGLIGRYSDQPALTLSFAFTSAAVAVEDLLGKNSKSSHAAYRCGALIAADVAAIETMFGREARLQDLLLYWQRFGSTLD